MNNIVIRKCLKCGYFEEDRKAFTYLGDNVWSCHNCCSKYTEVKEVIDPDKTGVEKYNLVYTVLKLITIKTIKL